MLPTRTARENPMIGSYGDPPLMFWRIRSGGVIQCSVISENPLTTDHRPLWLQPLGIKEADQVDNPVGVAPLVVVPAQNLDALADHLGQRRVHNRGERVALKVRADQLI